MKRLSRAALALLDTLRSQGGWVSQADWQYCLDVRFQITGSELQYLADRYIESNAAGQVRYNENGGNYATHSNA